ncbi:MAG: NAD-dependent protein deacylase [Ruminococcus sp.]|nr:NAD-dependent protein deacylase [Ruminococcus sp.]
MENGRDLIAELEEMLKDSRKIVFFGGAGVSTESGIPDFRSADGIYSRRYGKLSPERIISRSFFDESPREFYDFYRDKLLYLDAKPNAAHKKLAELEKAGKDVTVVTQNIDGLHQLAGSKKVIELHGSVLRNYCMKCGAEHSVEYVKDSAGVPYCLNPDCNGVVKPDVVLYEESLKSSDINGAINAIEEADMLIIAGTSLIVYPAASFVNYFHGKHSAIINLSASERDSYMELIIHRKVGEVLGAVNVTHCI